MGRIEKVRRRTGMTALETIMSVFIVSLVLIAGAGVMTTTWRSWTRGTLLVDAENDTAVAMRVVVNRLQEALTVQVASDGRSVTYWLPQKGSDGNYRLPVTPETQSRRFHVSDDILFRTEQGRTVPLLSNISPIDPGIPGSNKTYRPFRAGSGVIPRAVEVHLVVRSAGSGGQTGTYARQRQVVYLRNVAELE